MSQLIYNPNHYAILKRMVFLHWNKFGKKEKRERVREREGEEFKRGGEGRSTDKKDPYMDSFGQPRK